MKTGCVSPKVDSDLDIDVLKGFCSTTSTMVTQSCLTFCCLSFPLHPVPLQLFFLCHNRLWMQDANFGQWNWDHPPPWILFLLLLNPASPPQILINPRAVPQSPQYTWLLQRGCVSFPITPVENPLRFYGRQPCWGAKLAVRLLHAPRPISAFPHCGLPPAHTTPVSTYCDVCQCMWYPEQATQTAARYANTHDIPARCQPVVSWCLKVLALLAC